MPRTIEDIYNDYPELEILEVVGYNDGGPFGLSADARILKIHNEGFARELATMPGANTEAGYTTPEGFRITGGWNILKDSYKAFVRRSVA